MIKKVSLVIAVLTLMTPTGFCENTQGVASVQEKHFYFSYKVLDKYGVAVPNAKIRVVAVSEAGVPHGPTSEWHFFMGTDADGMGFHGFGDLPERKAGYLQIIAEHPSIEDAKQRIEWDDALVDVRPHTLPDNPSVIIIKANGGTGIVEWRRLAAENAPNLVEALLESTNVREMEKIESKLIKGEMASIPALVHGLRDYHHPHRTRLVDALYLTWNRCRAIGPVNKEIKKEAFPIFVVAGTRFNYPMKPLSQPNLKSLGFEAESIKQYMEELRWQIGDLRSKIKKEENENKSQQADRSLLRKFTEILEETINEYK